MSGREENSAGNASLALKPERKFKEDSQYEYISISNAYQQVYKYGILIEYIYIA